MINKSMNDKSDNDTLKEKKLLEKKPNETGGIYFSSHIKIYDPETQQVLVQKRGDV